MLYRTALALILFGTPAIAAPRCSMGCESADQQAAEQRANWNRYYNGLMSDHSSEERADRNRSRSITIYNPRTQSYSYGTID